MDLGNYELGKSKYEYTPVNPQNSNLKGLMTTDYGQLKKDLQTPGDFQINQAFDKADTKTRDIMGGNGMYGSSIYGDTINQSTLNRSNALASNAANAGATVERLKSSDNQWFGNAALDENRLENTWNMGQDQMNKTLIHDLILSKLGNENVLSQIDKQGKYGMNMAQYNANSNEAAAKNNAWGQIGGVALKGLMDWAFS